MQETITQLGSIQEKIKLVQQKIEEQKKLNADLQASNSKLEEQWMKSETEKETLQKENADLHEQVKMLKVAKALTEEEEGKKTEMKLILNEMIKEVDKCIAVINN